jgi:hypothetical protein
MSRFSLVVALTAVLLGGCATTIPVGERESVRQELNDRAEETLALLLEREPELQDAVDSAVGHFVARVSAAQVAVIGGGVGLGVLYDKEAGTRTYMNVTRYDLGMGVGAGALRVVVLFQTRETLEQFRSGTWKSGVRAESASGTTSVASPAYIEGATVHVIPESGAAVTVTARFIRLSVNTDLTDTGLSELSLPGIGFTEVDEQGEDAPRVWNRKLPFLAQRVIDLGYDLPLPYGIGLTLVHVDQDLLLSDIEVGINGRPQEPFEFVSFKTAASETDGAQLKLDAWLFPFMNVFALLGKIDGTAPVDVVLDGNGMLDQLGISCPSPNPLCPLLQDQTFELPTITSEYRGTTYGLGTVFAGGWNNWFVTLPFSLNYADLEGKGVDGLSYTVTPRFGRVVNLRDRGNLALFVGGNYLKAELTVSGQVSTPDGLIVIDYTIEQKNKDRWNALVGANWDISKRWALLAEYNGFTGSRESVVLSLTRRF